MSPEKKTRLYLTMANVGAIATVGYIAATTLDWPDFVRGLFIGILLVSVAMLLRRRLRDEYIQALWNAGTAVAFVVLVIVFLFAPVIEGFFDGLLGTWFDSQGKMDTPVALAPALAILGFFIGFHWARFRGRA